MFSSFKSNISSNYQVSPHPVVVSGPWKVHDGKKKSTGTVASIFIFDKKFLEPQVGAFGKGSSASTKKLQEEAIERLKREASSLARLRHPSILQVLEPVEETRSGGLMFATEHVTASLDGLLRQKDDKERGYSRASHTAVEIDELEIQKGLLQVAKGLEFMHESAGLVHGNLNPRPFILMPNLTGRSPVWDSPVLLIPRKPGQIFRHWHSLRFCIKIHAYRRQCSSI